MERLEQKGFTLIELMIAMVIGLIMTGIVVSVFVDNRHSFNQGENIQRMQDDARLAVRELAHDLSMAGFWADLLLPDSVIADGSLAVVTDCGPAGVVNWIYQAVNPGTVESTALTAVDNATGAAANAAFSCIAASEVQAGTDIVAIKRLAGAEVAVPQVGRVYLRTNGTIGLLYREPENTPPAAAVPVPFREWEYRPSIYYIRNFAVTAGDGIPTLCRKTLAWGLATPTMATECIAQGVENLQIEYGLDTSGDGDPNVYVSSPTAAQFQQAVSARIDVLTRSVNNDIKYTNDKTYSISNAPDYTPADNFYRRVYSITIGLHNPQSLRILRS